MLPGREDRLANPTQMANPTFIHLLWPFITSHCFSPRAPHCSLTRVAGEQTLSSRPRQRCSRSLLCSVRDLLSPPVVKDRENPPCLDQSVSGISRVKNSPGCRSGKELQCQRARDPGQAATGPGSQAVGGWLQRRAGGGSGE